MKKNLTDITKMSDAALDVFLSVKAGDEVVDCNHLTAAERYQVTQALGINASSYWLNPAPSYKASKAYTHGPDFEAMILEDQDERFGD